MTVFISESVRHYCDGGKLRERIVMVSGKIYGCD